ncbi:unnamed protein product [Lampetra fluviatilis]
MEGEASGASNEVEASGASNEVEEEEARPEPRGCERGPSLYRRANKGGGPAAARNRRRFTVAYTCGGSAQPATNGATPEGHLVHRRAFLRWNANVSGHGLEPCHVVTGRRVAVSRFHPGAAPGAVTGGRSRERLSVERVGAAGRRGGGAPWRRGAVAAGYRGGGGASSVAPPSPGVVFVRVGAPESLAALV